MIGKPRRRAVAAAAAVVGTAGCGLQKPTPIVTLVSGGSSVYAEAARYCFEGQDPAAEMGAPGACSVEERAPVVLRVRPGDQVGVDVARELAETGWFVSVTQPGADQPNRSGVRTGHYFTFQPPFQDNRPLTMEVVSLADPDPANTTQRPTGTWTFVLAPR